MPAEKPDPERAVQPLIFVSYAHSDLPWLARLQKVLKPKTRLERYTLWDDRGIATGELWQGQIDQAIAHAHLAVLLVSIDFRRAPRSGSGPCIPGRVIRRVVPCEVARSAITSVFFQQRRGFPSRQILANATSVSAVAKFPGIRPLATGAEQVW